jgi:uncharacterized SAM-binding protein YcdF (DUF218 family)
MLSDFITPLFEPLGLVWVALLLFVIIALRQKCRLAAAALFCLAAVLTLVGSTPLPFSLMGSLERPYTGKTIAAARPGDAVIMLGGAHYSSPYDTFHLGLSGDATRFLTAVEAVRQHKGGALVVGGYKFTDPKSGLEKPESPLLKSFIESWNVCPVPIIPLENCLTTREESVGVQKLARERHWKRVVVVTSAYHMARAAALFRQTGLDFDVIACDFKSAGRESPPFSIFPSPGGFQVLHVYLHEVIGSWFYHARGWIAD